MTNLTQLNWQHVTSSNLSQIAYDSEKKRLYIEFKDGDVYEYMGVGAAMFRDMTEASSVGSFFAQNIRDNYVTNKV